MPLEDQPQDVTVPPLPSDDHACDVCNFTYREVSLEQARRAIARIPAEVRAEVLGVAEPHRHLRPDPDAWSVTEYVCHVRDVLTITTVRLHRTRTETVPALEPMLNDVRARRFRYNQRVLEPVLDEIGLVAKGLGDEIREFATDEWQRTATRLRGETRTALWLVRHAAHEGVHHMRDIGAVGRRLADDDRLPRAR